MAHSQIERFARIVEEDRAVRDELWALTEPTQFVATVVRRAGERGITIVDGEVWEAFNEGRLMWLDTQAL